MESAFCSECRDEIDPKISRYLDNNLWRCNACESKNLQTRTAIKDISCVTQHTFKDKNNFPKHIIIIQGDPPLYKCMIDDKIFKSKSHCCYHKHCPDVNEKPFLCTTCNRRFASKTHLSYHNLTHTGVNPFKCDQCDKSFKTRNKLQRHKEVHLDERKLYPCKSCDKSFLTRASLKVHRRIHTGEKPYTCSYCSKAFTEKKKLINHISLHTGDKNYSCKICGKTFAIKSSLEIHKKVHSNVKPYKCRYCNQVFSQNRYLKRHLETHKDSAKNSCKLCDKKFSRKDNLKRHIMNIHEEYQNPNNFDVNRCIFGSENQIRNDSSIITNDINCSNNVTVIRTESVIKSLTKTQEIINFNCKEIENISSRKTVIMKIDKTLERFSPVHSVIVMDGVNSYTKDIESTSENTVNKTSQYLEKNIKENSIQNLNSSIDRVEASSINTHNQDDRIKSPRCFLPKKLFVASLGHKNH